MGGLGEKVGMTWAHYRPETYTPEKLTAARRVCHKSEQLLVLTDRSRGAPLLLWKVEDMSILPSRSPLLCLLWSLCWGAWCGVLPIILCALLLTASKCPSTKLPGSAWAGVAAAASLGQGLTAPGWAEMWCWAVGRVTGAPGEAGQGQSWLAMPSGTWQKLFWAGLQVCLHCTWIYLPTQRFCSRY